LEPQPYDVFSESRGMATESTAEAYRYLAIVRKQFKSTNSTPSPRVKEALAFLRNHESIDCTRFLLFALNVLAEADDDFARHYDSFWPVYGALSAEVLRRHKKTGIDIRPAEVSTRFADKFKDTDTPWDVREKIIRGFIEFARQTRSRDLFFWETVNTFFVYCQRELNDNPEIVPTSIAALAKFWEILADKFGEAPDVRENLAKIAPAFLDLILESRISWANGLYQWKEALFHLKLPVADPLNNELVPRSDLIQKPLDRAAEKISALCRDQNHPLHAALRGVQEPLVGYLHGLAQQGERAAPPDPYDHAEATFRFGGLEISKKARIADICLRTCRGFRIEVDGLSPRVPHDGNVGRSGEVDGRPARVVDTFLENQSEPVRVDSVDLRVRHPMVTSGAKSGEVLFPAKIVRAWPDEVRAGRSGWALLAPPVELPSTWTTYVQSLTSITRNRAR